MRPYVYAPSVYSLEGWRYLHGGTACLALRMKVRTLPQSFVPGVTSTPLHTSTAYGRTVWIASQTFSGVSPPARMIRPYRCNEATRCQSACTPPPPYTSG